MKKNFTESYKNVDDLVKGDIVCSRKTSQIYRVTKVDPYVVIVCHKESKSSLLLSKEVIRSYYTIKEYSLKDILEKL